MDLIYTLKMSMKNDDIQKFFNIERRTVYCSIAILFIMTQMVVTMTRIVVIVYYPAAY